jgi:hypothetical protein
MRGRLAALILTTGLALIAGAGLNAAAEPVPDDWCLGIPAVSENTLPFERKLTNVPLPVPIEVRLFTDNLQQICSGMTATVQKADGTLRTVVPLDQDGGMGMPPSWTKYGFLSAPVANGAGDWVITKVTWGAKTLDVQVPFRVIRGSVFSLEQPARTSGTARTTITGVVRQYTSTGALAPSVGRTVSIMHENNSQITTAKTDSTGRYRATAAFTQNTTLRAIMPATVSYGPVYSAYVTAHKLLAMSYLTAAPIAYVNTFWKVTGTAFPGKLFTSLEYWNGTAWESTQSFGSTAANGSYARYWKPTRTGTFRVRATVSGDRLDNSPWRREISVTVKQLPQQPTYLSGTIAPTAGPPVKYQTKMSSFGLLKIRKADGTIGPLANGYVQVLARRPADNAWTPVGGSTTTSSGYFYNNWYVPFQAGETFTAVVRYTTTLPRAASSTSTTFGPFAVQP